MWMVSVRKGALILALALILSCLLFMDLKTDSFPGSNQLDLINGQDWSHISGVTNENSSLRVNGIGSSILGINGQSRQPNPPVNIRGPRLNTEGQFILTADIAELSPDKMITLRVYKQAPVIYDEWRWEPAQMSISLSQNKLQVGIKDASGPNFVEQKSWNLGSSQEHTVKLTNLKKMITLSIDDYQVGSLPNHQIFSSQDQLLFGLSTPPQSSALLKQLYADGPKGQLKVSQNMSLKVPLQDKNGLRQINTNNRVAIGAAVSYYQLFSDNNYRSIVANQFNMITPENELKPQFVHPQPNVYSFAPADSEVEFAQANGMKVHGHNLVFSEANPQWMMDAKASQRQKILEDHINTVVTHYKNQISEWDVVDEPMSDEDPEGDEPYNLRTNLWLRAIGPTYIDTAFQTARQASPDAKLYINEYGLENDGPRWNSFLALIKDLQSRGVPIDGIGFQAHVHESGDEVNEQTVLGHMNQLASLGLLTRISEADVHGEDPNLQASQYQALLKACLQASNCTSFNTWGVTDKYGSTTEINTYPPQLGDDLIWGSQLQPKLALQSLQQAIIGQ
jgi:endo-1,4-beta-xylanase